MNIYYSVMNTLIAIYMAAASLFYTPTAMKPVNPNPVPDATTKQELTIMTYNVKTSGVGKYSVENRKDLLIENIRAYMPDSIGFEEANQNWVKILDEELTEYDYVGVGRDKGNTGEASPVFYLKDKYELVKGGTFWISETPDEISKGWDALIYNRICTYAVLKDKQTGFTYAHFSAHLDNLAVIERLEGAKVICDKIAEIAPDIPVVLTGDFNDDQGSDMYNRILEAGMRDTKFMAKDTMDSGTFHGYSAFQEKYRVLPIDFVFVNAYCSDVAKYKVDLQKYNGIYPSDHHPVIVDLTLYN